MSMAVRAGIAPASPCAQRYFFWPRLAFLKISLLQNMAVFKLPHMDSEGIAPPPWVLQTRVLLLTPTVLNKCSERDSNSHYSGSKPDAVTS